MAAKAALAVNVEKCVNVTTPEKLVLQAAKVAKAAVSVEQVDALPSPAGEDVDVGGG